MPHALLMVLAAAGRGTAGGHPAAPSHPWLASAGAEANRTLRNWVGSLPRAHRLVGVLAARLPGVRVDTKTPIASKIGEGTLGDRAVDPLQARQQKIRVTFTRVDAEEVDSWRARRHTRWAVTRPAGSLRIPVTYQAFGPGC
jgi:hypothetical protein